MFHVCMLAQGYLSLKPVYRDAAETALVPDENPGLRRLVRRVLGMHVGWTGRKTRP